MSEQTITADGLDQALIGKDYKRDRAVYSIEKIVEILQVRDNMTHDEAIEFFDFNIGGAYVGEMTPLYVWTNE